MRVLWFVVISFTLLNTLDASAQDNPERNRCDQCWWVYRGNIEMSRKYERLASERPNGTAGGSTFVWWNSQTQKYYDRIRECCTDDEMGERCQQLGSPQELQMCIGQSAPPPKTPENSDGPTEDSLPKEPELEPKDDESNGRPTSNPNADADSKTPDDNRVNKPQEDDSERIPNNPPPAQNPPTQSPGQPCPSGDCSPGRCDVPSQVRPGFIVKDEGREGEEICEFRRHVRDILAQISRFGTGQELILYFALSPFGDIEIESFGACAATTANGFVMHPTALSCNDVCGVPNPIHVAVYHELVHLWAGRQGMNRLEENIAVGIGPYEYLGANELRFSENKYRDQLRLPLRRCY